MLLTALVVAAPAQPMSTAQMQIPLQVEIPSIAATAEANVPRDVTAEGAWTMVDNDSWGIKYHLERDPLSVQVQGTHVSVATNVRYRVKACKRVKKPWPLSGYICPEVASCGYNQMVSARASAELDVGVDAAWTLRLHRSAVSVQSAPCRVTIFNISIGHRIEEIAQRHLSDGLDKLSATVAARTSVRTRADELWTKISEPRQLGPGAWLRLRPRAIALGSVNITDTSAAAIVTVTLQPDLEVRAAAPPAGAVSAPPLGNVPGGSDHTAHLDVVLSGEALQAQLRTALVASAIPGALADQLTVTTSSSGIEVRVPFQGANGAVLRAQLVPQLHDDDVTMALRSLTVTNVSDEAKAAGEEVLRAQFADASALHVSLASFLKQIDGKSHTFSLGGGAEAVIRFGSIEVKSVATSDAGIVINLQVDGEVNVHAPSVGTMSGGGVPPMPMPAPPVRVGLPPGTFTFACGCWGPVLSATRLNAMCVSGIERAVPCPGTFCPMGGLAYAGQCM